MLGILLYKKLFVVGYSDDVSFTIVMQFKPEEIDAIKKDFDEPGSLAPTGLHLGGTKYMVIQGEPGAVIRGKKVCVISISPCWCFILSHLIISTLSHFSFFLKTDLWLDVMYETVNFLEDLAVFN